MEVVRQMLMEQSSLAMGAIASALNRICPERLDIIAPRYVGLCQALVEIDEWSQIAVINLLVRIAR